MKSERKEDFYDGVFSFFPQEAEAVGSVASPPPRGAPMKNKQEEAVRARVNTPHLHQRGSNTELTATRSGGDGTSGQDTALV